MMDMEVGLRTIWKRILCPRRYLIGLLLLRRLLRVALDMIGNRPVFLFSLLRFSASIGYFASNFLSLSLSFIFIILSSLRILYRDLVSFPFDRDQFISSQNNHRTNNNNNKNSNNNNNNNNNINEEGNISTNASTTSSNNSPSKLRLGSWKVERMDLVGTQPIALSQKGEQIFVSDHFGLFASLKR